MALTREQAFRHLKRATFGPQEADVTALMASDIDTWLISQLRMSPRADHVPYWRTMDAARIALNPTARAGANDVIGSFYRQALTAPDQLRQRMAYTLSQIMVVSTLTISGPTSLMVASFYDLLTKHAFGNFRDLLFDVATHPAMGKYLSHLGNYKADPVTGSLPDQNFAREVMQLFSIGLYVLNADGSPVMVNGVPQETYTQDDIEGMARVMTGWSWAGPSTTKARFEGGLGQDSENDPDKYILPMQPYAQYHETGAKTFLGITVPANTDALATMGAAIDRLFNHQSTAPFICRQLYQRLVDCAPTPAEVAKISAVFADDGNGVRGNLGAVVRAILLDAAGLAITAFPQPAVAAPTLASLETYRTSGTAGQELGSYAGIPYKMPGFPDNWSETALGGAASLIFDMEVTSGTVPAGGRPILFLCHPNTGTGFRDFIAAGRPAEALVLAARASAIGWVIVNGEFPHPLSSIAAVGAAERLPYNALGRMLQHVRAYHTALNLNRSAVYAAGRSRGSAVLDAAFGRNLAFPVAATYWERQDSSDIKAVYTIQGQTMYYAPQIAQTFIVPADRAAAVSGSPPDNKDPRLAAQSNIYTLLCNSKASTLVWAEAAEQWFGAPVSWSAFASKDMVHYPDFALSVQRQLAAAGKAANAVVNHSVGAGDINTYKRILPWFESILTAPRAATAAEHAAIAESAAWGHGLYYLGPAGEGAAALADGTGTVTLGGKIAVVVDGAKGLPNRLLGSGAQGTPAAMTSTNFQPTATDRGTAGGRGWSMTFPAGGYLQIGVANTSAQAWAATPGGWVDGLKGRAAGNWRVGGDAMEAGLFVGVPNNTVLAASQRIYMQLAQQIMGITYPWA